MSLSTAIGISAATGRTKSQGPRSMSSSTIRRATRLATASNSGTIPRPNTRATMRRSRACSGLSMLIMEP
jgi:hypothetical protein